MADGGLYSKPHKASSSSSQNKKKQSSKLHSHFMFKAIIVALFLVIIPLFPSEAPEVISPSFFSRWWELLHLIFVGIAVSYGLFSRKNYDDDDDDISQGDVNSKFDNAQSYVSKLLQVPPVFDDDVDTSIGSSDDHHHQHHSLNKIQTWSSQYYRNEPVVVVANGSSNVDRNNNGDENKSGVSQKPLLLPVRSLKSRVPEDNDGDLVDSGVSRGYNRLNSNLSGKDLRRISTNNVNLDKEENSGVSRVYARSNSSLSAKGFVNDDSRRMSRNHSVKSQSGVRNEFGFVNGGGEVSRSLSNSSSNLSSRGFSRISRKRGGGDYGGGLDEEDAEEHKEKVEESSVVLPSPIPWRSRSGSMEINQESLDSSLHSLPASLEESGAAQLVRSQSSMSSRSSSSSSSPKELSPSPSMSSPRRLSPSPSLSSESLAKGVEDFGRRKLVYGSHLPPPPPPPPPPPAFHKSPIVKSNSSKKNEGMFNHRKDVKQSVWNVPKDVGRSDREEMLNRTKPGLEAKSRNSIDIASMGKSVRTFRAGEMISPRKTRELQQEEGRSEYEVSDMSEMPERKTAGYNRMTKSSFSEFPKETRDFLEQVLVGTDGETESEDENNDEERVETPNFEEAPSDNVDEGPDVDKKADEFIAKFREQIRLQRIESIKRSTGQLERSAMR